MLLLVVIDYILVITELIYKDYLIGIVKVKVEENGLFEGVLYLLVMIIYLAMYIATYVDFVMNA